MNEQIIPIFFAVDNDFLKYTVVSLHSIIKNASKEFKYQVRVLYSDLPKDMMEKVTRL